MGCKNAVDRPMQPSDEVMKAQAANAKAGGGQVDEAKML